MDDGGSLIYFSPPLMIDNKTSCSPYMSTKLGQTLFMQMLANNINIQTCSVWTRYGLYTDALRHKKSEISTIIRVLT